MSLCLIEFLLGLLATGTAPVVGQFFEGHAVMLCRVIDVATDGADILAASLLFSEIDFCNRADISSFIKNTKAEPSIVPSNGISSPMINVVVIGCKINTFS